MNRAFSDDTESHTTVPPDDEQVSHTTARCVATRCAPRSRLGAAGPLLAKRFEVLVGVAP